MMVNGSPAEKHGTLQFKFLEQNGETATVTQTSFHLKATGAERYLLTIRTPTQARKYALEAAATSSDNASDSTLSRRRNHNRAPRNKALTHRGKVDSNFYRTATVWTIERIGRGDRQVIGVRGEGFPRRTLDGDHFSVGSQLEV